MTQRFTHVLFALAAIACFGHAQAQCPFDPTITPDAPILCPNTQEVLMTQAYDAYQWYKDGAPIPGATQQTHVVDAFQDGGSQFSVEATLDGCAELSPPILVDGWVFLPPTVATVAPPFVGITPDLTLYCVGDTVLLVMQLPYDTGIQWINQGLPIPGATDDTLIVTTGGQFSVSGAPSTCPDFVQQLGLYIGIGFVPPTQPDVVPNGNMLCAYPTGESYQWYYNGQPLAGSNSACIDGSLSGSYVVDVTYITHCSIPSAAYLVTGISSARESTSPKVFPQPARDRVTISWGDGTALDGWRVFDATGRTVLQAAGPMRSPITIDVQGLRTGRYWLRTEGRAPVPFAVVE